MTAEKRLIDLLVEDFDSSRTKHTLFGRDVYTTSVSVEENTAISAKHPEDATGRLVETLVQKCTDVDGNPVFTVEDKPLLRRKAKLGVVTKLLTAIHGETVEAQAKNSDAGGL